MKRKRNVLVLCSNDTRGWFRLCWIDESLLLLCFVAVESRDLFFVFGRRSVVNRVEREWSFVGRTIVMRVSAHCCLLLADFIVLHSQSTKHSSQFTTTQVSSSVSTTRMTPITHTVPLLLFAILFATSPKVSGFVAVGRPLVARQLGANHVHNVMSSSSSMNMLSVDAATSVLTSAVEIFDGSGITDSVVRSNNFWNNLQGQLGAFFLGQFTALILFTIGASVVAQQAPQILEQVSNFVGNRIFSEIEDESYQKLRVPPLMQSDQSSSSQQPSREINVDVQKLLICLAIDFLGSASELIPIYGELLDIVYAPFAAYFLRSNFGGSNVAFVLEFAEEILPLTDVLPFATICWIIDTFAGDSTLAKLLQLGDYRPQNDAIEVNSIEVQQDLRQIEGSDEQTREKLK